MRGLEQSFDAWTPRPHIGTNEEHEDLNATRNFSGVRVAEVDAHDVGAFGESAPHILSLKVPPPFVAGRTRTPTSARGRRRRRIMPITNAGTPRPKTEADADAGL